MNKNSAVSKIMKTYTLMTIGETISVEQTREFNNIADAHLVTFLEANHGVTARRLWKDGGNMVVIETTFPNHETCIRYHTSREYRQFVTATRHLLVGSFVVKLFEAYDVSQLSRDHSSCA